MALYMHEMKQGLKTFLLWTIAIICFMAMCTFLFPEMKDQMEEVSKIFSVMGAFTAAFGMDKLNFGSFMGFYTVECGNIISLGGAFFSAVIAVNVLSKEEKEHTAGFLMAHPLSRGQIQRSKLAALFTQLTALHLFAFAAAVLSIRLIGEPIAWKDLLLLHVGCYLCQLEIGMICYAVSAFSRGNNFGAGIGITMVLYFMSLLANVSDRLKLFHIISPFGYAEGSDIITQGRLDIGLILLGMIIGLIFLIIGIIHYQRKDLL